MKKHLFFLLCFYCISPKVSYSQTIADAERYLTHEFICGPSNSDGGTYTARVLGPFGLSLQYRESNPDGRTEYTQNCTR
jgi:hypothetical protein